MLTLSRRGAPVEIVLGEAHYRRSEVAWRDAGRPRAVVRIAVRGDVLELSVAVTTPQPC